jgi:hypothetical protein
MKPPAQMDIAEFSKLMEEFKSKNDCPAAPICVALKTARLDCLAGGNVMANQSQFCLVSIVALLGRMSGITLKPTPSRKIEGFSGGVHARSGTDRKVKPSSEVQ